MSEDERYFLWFSDIHFDPYYGTPQGYSADDLCNITSLPSIGKHGCDSPEALVRSVLQAAADVASDTPSKPSFIIVTGDSSEFVLISVVYLSMRYKLMLCIIPHSSSTWDGQIIHQSHRDSNQLP